MCYLTKKAKLGRASKGVYYDVGFFMEVSFWEILNAGSPYKLSSL